MMRCRRCFGSLRAFMYSRILLDLARMSAAVASSWVMMEATLPTIHPNTTAPVNITAHVYSSSAFVDWDMAQHAREAEARC